jgi:glycosyltransferase involved in cell wall biosynthesis
MPKSILFIAPFAAKHGQGRVSKLALEAFLGGYAVRTFNTDTNRRFLGYAMGLARMVMFLVISSGKRYDFVYFTPSRASGGGIRDIFLLTFIYLRFIRSSNIFAHVHGSDHKVFLNKVTVISVLLKYLYEKLALHYILLSESHKDYVHLTHDDTVSVVTNPHQVDVYDSHRDFTTRKFVFVSFPHKDKGLDLAIDVLQSYGKFHLDIVGWNVNDYEKFFGSSTLGKNVVFHGFKSQREVNEIVFKADIMIFTSRYESEAQPLVVINALCTGIPVLLNRHKMLTDFAGFPGVYFVEDLKSLDELNYDSQECIQNREAFSECKFKERILNVVD